MNIYKVTGTKSGYDTYDSFICYAKNENTAKRIHPDGESYFSRGNWIYLENKEISYTYGGCWDIDIKDLTVELLGSTTEKVKQGVILASFHAG